LKPLLIDLDGVIKSGNTILPNTKEFLDLLAKYENPKIILSNSTLVTSNEILDFFEKRNISIKIPIITASDASLEYIKGKYKKVAVYAVEKVKSIFTDYLDYKNPEAVLVGDLDKEWNYEIMNEIFRFVRDGKDFIAMQKNRFWNTPEDGILLDAGAFIKGIEYAANKEAILIGKPSAEYFKSALKQINCKAESNFIMIGDDIINDIEGAKKLGAETILIYTGKTKKQITEEQKKFVDFEVNNLSDLCKLLIKIL